MAHFATTVAGRSFEVAVSFIIVTSPTLETGAPLLRVTNLSVIVPLPGIGGLSVAINVVNGRFLWFKRFSVQLCRFHGLGQFHSLGNTVMKGNIFSSNWVESCNLRGEECSKVT